MADQTCDFCGEAFKWADEQVSLDVQLRARGSGLGACCSVCDDEQIALSIKSDRLARRRERARERANG